MPGAAIPGDIVHVDGRVLGRHAGIVHYTIGQRRGLGVAAAEPLYVVALDAARRPGDRRSALRAGEDAPHAAGGQLDRRRRARRRAARRASNRRAGALDPPAGACAAVADGEVEFVEPESGVSPGQACVFYKSVDPRARVLGGGFIAAS